MSLSSYYLDYSRHVARLRRRRAYTPTSNTDSRDTHEKINSWVSFCFPYGYGAPLGGPSGRRSSAIGNSPSVLAFLQWAMFKSLFYYFIIMPGCAHCKHGEMTTSLNSSFYAHRSGKEKKKWKWKCGNLWAVVIACYSCLNLLPRLTGTCFNSV